ncbi:hypothetical protein FOA43_002873 [Brettanomyces nanus]|uniref:Genetic interactor of prohibitin 5, mitochondrial n=1 Tax=Eeniella nana TaxID=13502 RepID=A0A875S3J3_EENNA|nr:uncharacterized protein FOA43_002873 [Brettanomyces nanus]QPG75518.1 hypothetical protein FOA43_002873 [Brettanomyces nanus]
MDPMSSHIILTFYRNLQRNIFLVPLDNLAKQRLSNYVHCKFQAPNKDIPLYKRLEAGQELEKLLAGVKTKGDYNCVKKLLNVAFIDSQPIKSRLPNWLYQFVHARSIGRRNRVFLHHKYSDILKTKHLIDKFKSNKPLLSSYYAQLAKNQFESSPDNQSITQIIDGEMPDFSSNKAGETKTNAEEIKLLLKLRSEYKTKIQTKTKRPSFEVEILPSRFGQPLTRARLFNLVVNRIVKIQTYFKKYSPVSLQDLDYLNRLEKSNFLLQNASVQRGYNEFIRSSFAIAEDATVMLPDLNMRIFPASNRLIQYYNEV